MVNAFNFCQKKLSIESIPAYTNKCPNETTFTLSVRVYDEAPAIRTLRETH